MTSNAGGLPQHLNYLDLQAASSPNPNVAMVNQGAFNRSGLGFNDTNPMQMGVTNSPKVDMCTPCGSLEDLLGPGAFESLQLSTPTKAIPAQRPQRPNDDELVMSHSPASSSGCSSSFSAREDDQHGSNLSGNTTKDRDCRPTTNFLGMSMSATLSMEDRRRLTIEETAGRIAKTAFVPLAHSASSASKARWDVSCAKHDNRSAGCVRRHDDSDGE